MYKQNHINIAGAVFIVSIYIYIFIHIVHLNELVDECRNLQIGSVKKHVQ